MSLLKEIHDYKLQFVSNQKKLKSLDEIKSNIKNDDANKFCFSKKLKNEDNRVSIIGEIKKASPSSGKFLDSETDIVKIANTYEENNVSCISILTDEKYFKGNNDDLVSIKKNSTLPILRKDFIIDEYQIYESKAIGADCILIILSMINHKDADKFINIAYELGMDSIIEVHNQKELKIAENLNSNLIGINNRDLNNFVTDIEITIKVANMIKSNQKILISESGIHSKKDIDYIKNKTGINNFLIGELLMRSNNVADSICKLLN